MPSRQLGDPLLADRTAPVLVLPQRQQFPSSVQVARHGHAEAVLKVDFPRGIKRIRGPFDLRVSCDRHTGRCEQFEAVDPPRCIAPVPTEHPVPIADDVKVLVFNPSARLVRVPAFRPVPQGAEEGVVHRGEGLFTAHMAMIVCPPSDQRIELRDQVCWGRLRVGPNQGSGFTQEGVDTLAGGCHENRAVIVTDVLAEKVKASGDMRDFGLLGGENQITFVEELFHERADFGFEQFQGTAGDNEVISKSHQVDFGPATPGGSFGITFPQFRFEAVEGQIGQDGRANCSLRGTCFRPLPYRLLHESRFQPLLED